MFRPFCLLNVEGKIFFSMVTQRSGVVTKKGKANSEYVYTHANIPLLS